MKKAYQKPSLIPLGITVETGVMASSIQTETSVTVEPYRDGFAEFSGAEGFDQEDGGYIINF